jgi:hypothetical protein
LVSVLATRLTAIRVLVQPERFVVALELEEFQVQI